MRNKSVKWYGQLNVLLCRVLSVGGSFVGAPWIAENGHIDISGRRLRYWGGTVVALNVEWRLWIGGFLSGGRNYGHTT